MGDGSAITWKYPSCILTGDNSSAEFYSVAVTNNYQQADTGTKMIHLGKNTSSTIVSKGISAGHSENSYRGLVRSVKRRTMRVTIVKAILCCWVINGAHTFPIWISIMRRRLWSMRRLPARSMKTRSSIANQRGISTEDAVGLIVNGYAKEVLNKLPMEFGGRGLKLLAISLKAA